MVHELSSYTVTLEKKTLTIIVSFTMQNTTALSSKNKFAPSSAASFIRKNTIVFFTNAKKYTYSTVCRLH
jgi:hypothetical protein